MNEIEELKTLLTRIHSQLDKIPQKGFSLTAVEWKKLSSITGIKWPRASLTDKEKMLLVNKDKQQTTGDYL